jgi:hypothetical protein
METTIIVDKRIYRIIDGLLFASTVFYTLDIFGFFDMRPTKNHYIVDIAGTILDNILFFFNNNQKN